MLPSHSREISMLKYMEMRSLTLAKMIKTLSPNIWLLVTSLEGSRFCFVCILLLQDCLQGKHFFSFLLIRFKTELLKYFPKDNILVAWKMHPMKNEQKSNPHRNAGTWKKDDMLLPRLNWLQTVRKWNHLAAAILWYITDLCVGRQKYDFFVCWALHSCSLKHEALSIATNFKR